MSAQGKNRSKRASMDDVYRMAESFIGTAEIKGGQHNPLIVGFAKSIGNEWVTDDETPWCASFVGAMLRLAGFKSTRSLRARSYEKWGKAVVDFDNAKRGDVVVLSRGHPDSGKGHVAFLSHFSNDGDTVHLLGGNQGDQVQISEYDSGRIVAIRRGDRNQARRKRPGEPRRCGRGRRCRERGGR